MAQAAGAAVHLVTRPRRLARGVVAFRRPTLPPPDIVMPGLGPRLSGMIFADVVHGIDSTRDRTSPNVPRHERTNAVPHENSVFHSLLKHLPWNEFERLVERHGSDKRQRGFTAKTHLVALIYGQLCGAMSLRDIEAGLSSHAARCYHLGIGDVRRSSLAEANAYRPSALFADLLALMMKRAHRGLRRKLSGITYLIDSTSITLTARSANWARFSAELCGAKVHIIYDPDADQPVYSAVTPANAHDITAVKAMPIEPGATYVYDLGYYDYGWWAALDAKGCRLVTRLKQNTPVIVTERRPLPQGGAILSDAIGFLPARQAKNRKNPFSKPIRELRVRIDNGKVLRIVTNDLAGPAQEIADLYKRRWAIELFFRWIKQTLKITRFLGTSENAIRTQIAVALITFLILRLAQATQAAVASPLTFARLVRANIMHKRDIRNLLEPQRTKPTCQNQLVLL
jgi:hypothetical protein